MKLTHIDNACCIYESNGFKLLADPWLTDGAFEGSWYHYPPLITKPADVTNVDALYISHLHPDHFDPETLRYFRRNIPIVILDHGANFLHRKLVELGFNNLIKVKDKETTTIGPFEVTLYAPFTKHPFDNSLIGNFIDSAMVVESQGKVILNANDNTPDVVSGKMLYEHHGRFDIAQLKDSLASAYPSCFCNLTDKEKLSEANRLINRQLTAMCNVANTLKAEWFQPFAGDYQLGGRLVDKNQFLGVAGKKYAAEFITSAGLRPLILNEQGSIDLITGELKASYRQSVEPYEVWTKRVSKILYAYEKEPEVSMEFLMDKLVKARQRLAAFQERFNYFPSTEVSVNGYSFNMGRDPKVAATSRIEFTLDNRALAGVLDKRYHWNNLEVGCHIEINRQPNVYDPDLVNAMCFFHI